MHPDFETLATLLPIAASSQVRKQEIKNIWNASLENGMENGMNIGTATVHLNSYLLSLTSKKKCHDTPSEREKA